MRFLLGDSTDAGLEVNYLGFLKDVIDCAVVLLEHEGTMASGGDRRRAHERESGVVIAALEELCRRSTELAEAVAKEQQDNSIGRCAATIVTQTREAVEKEMGIVRTELAADLAKVAQDDQALRLRGTDAIDKLLKSHDLPGAEQTIEVTWTATAVKAIARQHTGYGVEATTTLDIPKTSELTVDLRVDKLAENAELNALEVGGWLKKSDKLVAYKIGRYHVAKVIAAIDTTVRLRSSAEPSSGGFDLVLARGGEITIEAVSGEPVRELSIDGTNRAGIDAFVKKIDAAVRALTEKQTGTVVVIVDGMSIAEQPRSGVLAERLVQAVAPTVHKIAQHSRSPGELVLRRMLSEDRREEIFTPIADLTRRWANLPPASREIFAALRLEADPSAPLPEHSGPQRRHVPTSVPVNRPRLPASVGASSSPVGRTSAPTPHQLPTVVVSHPSGGRAITQTIPAVSVPAPATVSHSQAAASTAPAQVASGTLPHQATTLRDSVHAALPKVATPSVSVSTRLPIASAPVEGSQGAAVLAAAWGTATEAGTSEAAAASLASEASTAFIADAPPHDTSGIPSPVEDDVPDELDDELLDDLEEDPGSSGAIAMQASATAAARPESRQSRLDRLNDPAQHARVSAAIEAALGEIEDDEPAPR